MITDLYILDKCPSSDHLPVGLVISTALTAERCVNNEKHADKIPPIFRWSNAKDCNIKEYGKCSAFHLDRIHISDSCTCTNSNCSNRQHISDIDNVMRFGYLDLKRLLHAKNNCAKTTLYLDGMTMLRKRTLKLDITIFYGVIWENLSMAQSVN